MVSADALPLFHTLRISTENNEPDDRPIALEDLSSSPVAVSVSDNLVDDEMQPAQDLQSLSSFDLPDDLEGPFAESKERQKE